MFKLESYVTPYIFAYLGKYFKNFDPSDFQMSLWGGGAVFQNLNLDLEVLDQELCLPVTLVSGHIHELKISVPWTKVTSEPIQVNINTIEITLKLKSLDETTDIFDGVNQPHHAYSARKMEVEDPSSPPPGYMHNLISKILTNVHVNFENVIVKYVEEDIVLSLNIKRASYSTTDSNWQSAFVDLIGPNFNLRKKFEFSDLTICLDKTNTAGKIETYQEPLLYKCAFAVRIFQQFKTPFSKIAHFTRMDFLLDNMDFSITDEQVPMLMRLYNLMRSLFEVNLKTVALSPRASSTVLRGGSGESQSLEDPSAEEDEGGGGHEGGEGSLYDWGSWAVSWLPPISSILGEEIEDDGSGTGAPESSEEEDRGLTVVCHYGFYVNKMTITFKALERICDKPSYGRTLKVKFLPFLKCSLQGITADFVLRGGDEANYLVGVSHLSVFPVGFCPCGIVDGRKDSTGKSLTSEEYIRVGQLNADYSRNSMFTNVVLNSSEDELLLSDPVVVDYSSLFNYEFKYEGHVEAYSEEMMLQRTPAFALEYLQTKSSSSSGQILTGNSEEKREEEERNFNDTVDLGRDKLLTRVVLAPCYVAVCSGLIHRMKMISFAVESYNYEPYGEINRLMYRRLIRDRNGGVLLDLSQYGNYSDAYDVYQLTVIRPQIEIWAADHPEYCYESRDTHLEQKRRLRTGTPYSHFVPNWPKLQIVAECIDAKMTDPNIKFKSLVARASAYERNEQIMDNIVKDFCISYETKVYGFEMSVVSGAYTGNLMTSPCSLTYLEKHQLKTDLNIPLTQLDSDSNPLGDSEPLVSEKYLSTDKISFQFTWPQLNLLQVIGLSAVQNMERFSEHLITSSLLNDLVLPCWSSKMVMEMEEVNLFRKSTVSTLSDRVCIGSWKIQLEASDNPDDRLPVLIAPTPSHHYDKELEQSFGFIVFQRPLKNNNVEEETPEGNCATPVLIVKLEECKTYYWKEVLLWMSYSAMKIPHPALNNIPILKLQGSEVNIPLRPSSSSRTSSTKSRDGTSRKSAPLGQTNEEFSDPRRKGSLPDSHSHGSSGGGGSLKSSLKEGQDSRSSIPGYNYNQTFPPRGPLTKEEEDEEKRKNQWELWFLSNLNLIKNTFVHVEIDHVELWFILDPKKRNSSEENDGNEAGSVFIKFPKIHSHPQSFKKIGTEFHQGMSLPVQLDLEHFGGDLFPQRISLENMYFGTVEAENRLSLCSVPLSILVTFSLSTKGGKEFGSSSVVTTACIHTDIALVDVHFQYSQVLLLISLFEEFLETLEILGSLPNSVLLPPIDPNDLEEDGDLFIEKEASETSSFVMSASANSLAKKSNKFDKDASIQFQTSYEDGSIPGSSASEWIHNDENTNEKNVGRGEEVKVTCWVQMTVGMYRFSISSPNIGIDINSSESVEEKLVFEAEDIVSSLDIQSVFIKWSHKVSNIRLRNYERKTRKGSSNSSESGWNPGKTLGVVFSSGNEITREIQILTDSFNTAGEEETAARRGQGANLTPINLPVISGRSSGGGAHQKMRGSITITFTRVESSNFHRRAGVPSPIEKWNGTLYKFANEKDYLLYGPYDDGEESNKFLSEIDVQIKALDFVFNPLVFSPYTKIMDRILKLNVPQSHNEVDEGCVVPTFSNVTLPLIYLKTEAIRIFLKSNTSNEAKSKIPDFILLQSSALTILSQSENALNRTVVTPLLYQMAEKARILSVPGSPVEDREYTVDLQGVTISTGFWTEIDAKSQRNSLRSSLVLKTQGENPALEWNSRDTQEMIVNDVKMHPLLDRMELTIVLAPAIVYDRSSGGGESCKSYVVAGHALEVNVVSEINLSLNLQQLVSLNRFYTQTNEIMNQFTKNCEKNKGRNSVKKNQEKIVRKNESQKGSGLSRDTSPAEFDSGIDSLAHLPKIVQKLERKERKSNLPGGQLSPNHKHRKDRVPIDALFTSGITNITLYDIKFVNEKVVGVIPLAAVRITQPHFLISVSQRIQRGEISLFQLSLRLSSTARSDGKTLDWIPGPDKFPEKVFDSIGGERDEKTGISPPFFTFKIKDFLKGPYALRFDVNRPLKILLSQHRLNNILNLYSVLKKGESNNISTSLPLSPSPPRSVKKKEDDEEMRKSLGKISSLSLCLSQFVLCLTEEGSEVTVGFTSLDFHSGIQNGSKKGIIWADTVTSNMFIKSLSMTSTLYERQSVLLSPVNVSMNADCRWKPWLEYPMIVIRFAADPITINIGSQNILALLQVHQGFKQYLKASNSNKEEETKEEEQEWKSVNTQDAYEDDLRAGSFKFVRVNSSAELPQVYQIGFCEADRTMTWRYPQPRLITSIQASPIPMSENSSDSGNIRKLECTVEYWEDAMAEFVYFGSFTLSELEGTSLATSAKNHSKVHSYISTIWRIKIQTPLQEADSAHLVRPEILAACLVVNSIHDSTLVPRLKIFLQAPRLSVNFVNHLYFGGRGEEMMMLGEYSNNCLKHLDQQFGTLNVEMISFLLTKWTEDSTVDLSSYVSLDVLDYEYLTLIRVLQPVLLKLQLRFNEHQQKRSSHLRAFTELDVISKSISIRLGASVLHTLLASIEVWTQLITGWKGKIFEVEAIKKLESVNLNQIVILNTISCPIKILQVGTDEPEIIPGGSYIPFYWPTHKGKPLCKLGLKEKESWAYGCHFDLKKSTGYIVRNVERRSVFIHTQEIGKLTPQRVVTITGSLLVANALNENIQVGLLVRDKIVELKWDIPSQRAGPSQIINFFRETEHIRFRMKKGGKGEKNPWSSVVTPGDLMNSKSHSVSIPLFEERDGTLKTFSVWCSFIQETVEGEETTRVLIILTPFYRVRSFLPSETLVHISTAKEGNKENYILKGRGSELQLDFTGSDQVTNHLTLQSSPLAGYSNSSPRGISPTGGIYSTPSIPLLPDGPTLPIKTNEQISIDEILWALKKKKNRGLIHSDGDLIEKEQLWPFISHSIPENEEWILAHQPQTDLEVEFSPWIEGLPTVVLDVRPWGLIVNLTGMELILSLCPNDQKEEAGEDNEEGGWTHHKIPHKSVFSPKRISLYKGRFKLGFVQASKIVTSQKLRFSEEVQRTDVHHANVDSLIPLDTFSRLDLPQGNSVTHFTIETRIKKKILVMSILPTFSISNNTGNDLFLRTFSLGSNSNSTQKNKNKSPWDKENKSQSLDPIVPEEYPEQLLLGSHNSPDEELFGHSAHPLLTFSTEEEYSGHNESVKHLALRAPGGPWWFIQLMDFSRIFNNMNSSAEGVPAAATAIAIPTQGVFKGGNFRNKKLKQVTLPLIVSWTSKNGLVWIHLGLDPNPQVVLHNETQVSFLYGQSLSGSSSRVYQETQFFEQYRLLPPYAKGHYTFAQKYSGFPQLSSEKKTLPFLLLTKLPPGEQVQELETKKETLLFSSGDLIWSKELNLDGESSQYLSVGEFVDAKITVEKLGFSYYVYIQNMSSVEVSATDVRKRITNPSHGIKLEALEMLDAISKSVLDRSSDLNPKNLTQESLLDCCSDFVEKSNNSVVTSSSSWIFRCYLPTFSFVITQDFLSSKERRELVSVVLEDFFVEKIPVNPVENEKLRIFLEIGIMQKWSLKMHVGDVQLDSPGFPFERTCDFPVILKQQKEYKSMLKATAILNEKYHGLSELREFFNSIASNTSAMISLTVKYSQSESGLKSNIIDSVDLSCVPFYLNIEDRLLDFVLNSLHSTLGVVQYRLPRINQNFAAIQKNLLENDDEDDEIFKDALESLEEVFVNRKFDTAQSRVSSQIAVKPTSTDSTPDSNYEIFQGFCTFVNPVNKLAEFAAPVEGKSTTTQATVSSYDSGEISQSSLDDNASQKKVQRVRIPEEMFNILQNFSHPICINRFTIQPLEVCLTLRIGGLMYLAVDHSRLTIPQFEAINILTTSYGLGQTLAGHYTTGAIFQIGNPMRLIGSLELLGSPGSLASSVGGGLKDFFVYPYQGIFEGPTGFISGLGSGVSSLLKSITSGTLTSVTNWAWSVSRNIDKLTLDEEEQILNEAARRVQLEGFTDGFIQGLTGFGIRLLGAVGGLVHHPMQNAINSGVSPSALLNGVGKGMIGVVTRPIGGIVQFVAMTGQGVLKGAGWTPQLKMKSEGVVDFVWEAQSSIFKYEMKMLENSSPSSSSEWIRLIVHAVQLNQSNQQLKPLSLIISTKNVYLMDVSEDLLVSHFPLGLTRMEVNEDRNLISLRIAPPKKNDEASFVKERILDFVRGNSSSILHQGIIPPEVKVQSIPCSVQEVKVQVVHPARSSLPSPKDSREELIMFFQEGEEGQEEAQSPLGSVVGPIGSASSTTMFTAISETGRSLASSTCNTNVSIYPNYHAEQDGASSSGSTALDGGGGSIGDFICSPYDKSEFENVLGWVKMQQDEKYFKM